MIISTYFDLAPLFLVLDRLIGGVAPVGVDIGLSENFAGGGPPASDDGADGTIGGGGGGASSLVSTLPSWSFFTHFFVTGS